VAASRARRFDIVGVGALNVDVVVDATGAGRTLRDDEAAVGADEMAHLLARVADLPRRVALGGSAFNTVTAAARRRPRLDLGMVGVEGEVPFGAPSFRAHLGGLGVDVSALGVHAGPAGICLALEDRDVRSLRVAPGANVAMADHAASGEVADYLADARLIHVTSFLDQRTPRILADVLAGLRGRPDRPMVCLDPGHGWCTRADSAVRSLVATADLLLVNAHEFAALGRALDLGTRTVVVKYPGYAVLHREGTAQRIETGLPPLRTEQIRHPTGAGDVFAAGLLAASAEAARAGGRDTSGPWADLTGAVRSGLLAARAHLARPRSGGPVGAA
jgi:sugar/nucleoside kinase (ribokinase family)